MGQRLSICLALTVAGVTSVAHADTATTLVANDIEGTYRFIRTELTNEPYDERAFDEVFPEHVARNFDLTATTPGETVAIDLCTWAISPVVTPGRLRSSLMILAENSVGAERLLRYFKFPDTIWLHHLRRIEGVVLGEFASREYEGTSFIDELQVAIDREMAAQYPNYVRPEFEACGGYVLELEVQVAPKSAKIHLVPELFWKFCKAKGINPEDREVCDMWFPPLRNGEVAYLGGIYRFQKESGGSLGSVEQIDADRYHNSGAITFR